ncbi:MAG: glycosyltransferase family 4 protein [Bacteroidetes bacterium]|nr:glycosyltransferase family 4 protein [Bacteroidota bacterium]
MRIAVNTQLLLPGKLEGIGWFSYETLNRITAAHPEHEFVFIFDRPFDQQFIFSENIIPYYTYIPSRHPALWYTRFEHVLPGILKKFNADLFFSPDGWTSLRAKIRKVTVIHDLNFEQYPEDLPYWTRKYYKHYFPRFARASDRLITVSNFSKQDIVSRYHVDPDIIDVAYNGVSGFFHPLAESEIMQVRQELTNGENFFVYIGSLHPRKNIPRLFQAFDQFCEKCETPWCLVMVGEKMWKFPEMDKVLREMKFAHKVKFAGRLSGESANRVVASANALTYVSKFEGFGIPIIEAMCCDVPVITSNCTSMPEVAGDAALICDPFSVSSISDAMLQLAENQQLQQSLVEKGRGRRNEFSWDKTANAVWDSICKVL